MDQLTLFLILLGLGFFVGKYLEGRHYKSIVQREEELKNFPVVSFKKPVGVKGRSMESRLVCGCVVISIDYFKRVIAGIRNVFGGNISVFETLVDRARREAILRMKESCSDADQIINVRIETSSVYKTSNKGSVGSVEVIAYGTAITFK